MKIPQEILLLCKDVKVFAPSYCTLHSSSGKDVNSIVFNCVGARGLWVPAQKAFRVDALLHPMFGWQNVLKWNSAGGPYGRYEAKDDLIGSEDGSFEEVAVKLELDGCKNVFVIPQKVVKMLEEAAIGEVGYNAANFFCLSFKHLKEKCKKVC